MLQSKGASRPVRTSQRMSEKKSERKKTGRVLRRETAPLSLITPPPFQGKVNKPPPLINDSGAPARAKRAWDRAPYSWNMVNLFSLGCHVTDRAYASTDCTGRVGETIKRKGGVSQACVGKSSSFLYDIHNIVN